MAKYAYNTLIISLLLIKISYATTTQTQDFYQNYCQKHPQVWQGYYNLGNINYDAHNINEALANYERALNQCKGTQAQESIFYNLGNCHYRQSQKVEALSQKETHLKESIKYYESALALNSAAQDTQHNLQVAKNALEALKKEKEKKEQNHNNDQQTNTNSNDQQNNSPKPQQNQNGPSAGHNNSGAPEQSPSPSTQPAPNNKNNSKQKQANSLPTPQVPKQQDMENILNSIKKDEKIFSNSSSNPPEPVLNNW